MSYDQTGIKVHIGVKGFKKVIFTQNTTPPRDYRVCVCMYMHQLDPFYKSYHFKNYMLINLRLSTCVMWSNVNLGSFGVIWGHWGQKFIFTQKFSSLKSKKSNRLCSIITLLTYIMDLDLIFKI